MIISIDVKIFDKINSYLIKITHKTRNRRELNLIKGIYEILYLIYFMVKDHFLPKIRNKASMSTLTIPI